MGEWRRRLIAGGLFGVGCLLCAGSEAVFVPAKYQILSDGEWRARLDKRSMAARALDVTASVAREAKYVCQSAYRARFNARERYDQVDRAVMWKKGSEGLCVFLHGLDNDPMIWNPQLEELEKRGAKVDRFVPFIPHGGNCSLEEAAGPVLPHLVDYAEKNVGKPICLIGNSNGGRLATWLEVQLRRKAPSTPVRVSTIAAVHFGSPLINKMEEQGIADKFCSPVIRQELAYGSRKARELLDELASPLAKGVAARDYEFYASTEDLIFVPDLGTALPVIGKGEQYHLVHGQGHSSIVEAVAEQQIEAALKWIRGVSKK